MEQSVEVQVFSTAPFILKDIFMQIINNLLTPNKFLTQAYYLQYIFGILTILLLTIGLYQALIVSPPDYLQGNAVRIMYVHVPSAWLALMIYCLIAVFNLSGIVWRNPLSYMMAISAAPIGLCFNIICLITGSIWGKPTWGTWWVWDARLTSMLILAFLYVGYLILYYSYEDKNKGEKFSAILSLIGIVNIPIIKFSVEWWNTLHQPASIIRKGGISIASPILTPLMLMFAAFFSLFVFLLIIRTKTEIFERKLERQQLKKNYLN